ncbi:hypothetical protein BC793_15121 [Actinoplanes xinjiangensis]|uniref:Alcohol dehydrogenase-like protein n=1 Tax=Actinoplanes xinjiangensis TaxID=512350 RepID=A0A316EXS8_9ACTN|nr:hypothetical protein BC793_15121 [Actinoplanes xinjiangensis]GIF45211.1 hypothetical protein Axi01nite_95220 [Actinoplanes xinjiangensis]
MRALTVEPHKADSARISDVPDPTPGVGELLMQGLALGVCGTDREIAAGEYGWAPLRSARVHGSAPAPIGRRDPIQKVATEVT